MWAPLATERSPPPGPANWPRHADLPLTYHAVPDIADLPYRKKTALETPGVRESACRALAVGIDCSVIDR